MWNCVIFDGAAPGFDGVPPLSWPKLRYKHTPPREYIILGDPGVGRPSPGPRAMLPASLATLYGGRGAAEPGALKSPVQCPLLFLDA